MEDKEALSALGATGGKWEVFPNRKYGNSQGRKSLYTRAELDVSAFYNALVEARDRQGLTWSDVWRRLGVSRSTFTRMKKGGKPDVDALLTLSLWANLNPMEFMLVRPPGNESGKDRALHKLGCGTNPQHTA